MHHCLQIQEIVADIVNHAYNTPNLCPVYEFKQRGQRNYACPNHDTKTILSFALTCHAFLEPSLDALWSSQVSLMPLLSCFPSAFRRQGSEYVFYGASMPEDWDRVLFYARRITKLSHSDDSYIRLPRPDRSGFAFLSLYRPVLSIFPNLRSIECSSTEMLQYIHIFLGPSLVEFKFVHDGYWDQTMVARLFASIARTSSSIQTIMIDAVVEDSVPFDSDDYSLWDSDAPMDRLEIELCKMLSSLSYIQSLRLPTLRVSNLTLTCLSQIPTLHELWLREPDLGDLHISAGFPTLRELSIVIDSLESILSFMMFVSSKELRKIEIFLKRLPTADILGEVLQTFTGQTTLSQLSVSHRGVCVCDDVYPFVVTSGALTSLLGLTNLSKVSICLPCSYDIDDSFLRDLAIAWPHLEELCLLPSESWDCISNTTATGLLHLAVHCSKLTILSIIFDGTEIPDIRPSRPSEGYPCRLTSLSVGDSPITNPVEVAGYLACLFGNTQVSSWDNIWDSEEIFVQWKEVNKLIPSFFLAEEKSLEQTRVESSVSSEQN